MYFIKTERSKHMKAMELQGEHLELFNEIINLDTESIERVKKYIKRIASNKYKISRRVTVDEIDFVTDEEMPCTRCPMKKRWKVLGWQRKILSITHKMKCEKLSLHGGIFSYCMETHSKKTSSNNLCLVQKRNGT